MTPLLLTVYYAPGTRHTALPASIYLRLYSLGSGYKNLSKAWERPAVHPRSQPAAGRNKAPGLSNSSTCFHQSPLHRSPLSCVYSAAESQRGLGISFFSPAKEAIQPVAKIGSYLMDTSVLSRGFSWPSSYQVILDPSVCSRHNILSRFLSSLAKCPFSQTPGWSKSATWWNVWVTANTNSSRRLKQASRTEFLKVE